MGCQNCQPDPAEKPQRTPEESRRPRRAEPPLDRSTRAHGASRRWPGGGSPNPPARTAAGAGPAFIEVVRRRVPARGGVSTTCGRTAWWWSPAPLPSRPMSSLWTPSGEHPVDRPGGRSSGGPPPSSPGPAGGPPPGAPSDEEAELSPEERAAAEEYARQLDAARPQP